MSSRRKGVAAGSRPGIASIARDFLTLAELQCQLAALDFKESAARIRQAISLGAAGLTLLFSATTIGLAASGAFLAERFAWPIWMALATPAAVALLVSATLLSLAMAAVKGTIDVFSRSGEEFKQNIESVKASLEGDEFESIPSVMQGE